MDVDNDLDGMFIQQFSSMGTTDKDVLISEFQRLLGSDLNPACCAFFLDMNNWNLQAAIGSYYDYEQPSNMKAPSMSLVKDITIGEGESVPPNTNIIKTWRIQNSGNDAWPPGSCLRFISGEQFGSRERVQVESLQPGAMTDVSVEMTSPATVGIYQGQWRMQTPTGLYFGEMIWVILQVEEHGLLGVTQQLSKFGGEFAAQPHTAMIENPFASPNKLNQSPASSTAAQNGSLPGSPFTPAGQNQPTSNLTVATCNPAVRTQLFQVTGDTTPQPPNTTPNISPNPTSITEDEEML